MGSFMGHILPGAIFLLYGVWLCFKYPYKYFVKKRKRTTRSCCTLDMFEGGAKIFFTLVGIFAEQFSDNGPAFHLVDSNGEYLYGNIWSHCTMYMFFMFAGITDLLLHRLPNWTPRGVQYFALGLACFIEGYLFYFHTHGRKDLDVRIHVLLLFAIWGGAVSLFLLCVMDALSFNGEKNDPSTSSGKADEYIKLLSPEFETTPFDSSNSHEDMESNNHDNANENNGQRQLQENFTKNSNSTRSRLDCSQLEILLQLFFTTTVLVQGSWFCQIATILYPPGKKGWDATSHANITFATIFFAWHIAIMIAFVVGMYSLVGFVTSQRNKTSRN